MSHDVLYREEGKLFRPEHVALSGEVAWECPSNIALVKYWGKKSGQIPLNPSLSLTLQKSLTHTHVAYNFNANQTHLELEYFFEGNENRAFTERIYSYLESLLVYLPVLKGCHLKISSQNTFPHSAGIASSASAFGALALCLVSIEEEIAGILQTEFNFYQKASFLARLGSGSAARSLYGGLSLWGSAPDFKDSSNEYAIPLHKKIDPVFLDYCDSVLLIDKGVKQVSSSVGHKLMHKNPYAKVRFRQTQQNLDRLMNSMKNGDLAGFVELVEYEALSLHAMMMTSFPGYTLLKPESLRAIEEIRSFRSSTQIPVCFTIDAGANIHVLYPAASEIAVKEKLIDAKLRVLCIEHSIIHDRVGNGPLKTLRA